MVDRRTLEMLAARLRAAPRITVLTGAGVSAASGVPTFRGEAGLWRQFRPEVLATAEAFDRDPALVWAWYDWRRAVIAGCAPNAAHGVLARWSRALGSTTVTQNVDDLHQRAGTESLVRLHGSIWELSCRQRCASAGAGGWRDERVPLPQLPPRCPHCAGPARPAVVWFGEALDQRDLDRALAATQCDVFVTIGTSSVVYPAAGLVHAAARAGAFTVEINPESTDASPVVDLVISERAEAVLPELDATLTSRR
jgi:NAD-dependent deacetylase